MKIEIKSRWSGSVLFECEAVSLKVAVELAVEKRVNLRDADLRGAYLGDAYLRGADLCGAYLGGADLRGADLRGAYLRGADLRGAYLGDADLRGADLGGADLGDTKSDFIEKLTKAKAEVTGLYKALMDGRIDGSCYEGECCCFVGTIAKVRGVQYQTLGDQIGLSPDSGSPTEKWFMAIRKGDTPENNPVSNITAEWIEEWCASNDVKLPTRKVVWE